jgi:hypothetical protein
MATATPVRVLVEILSALGGELADREAVTVARGRVGVAGDAVVAPPVGRVGVRVAVAPLAVGRVAVAELAVLPMAARVGVAA